MTAVGFVAALLGLLAYRWASIRGERRDFVFFMILYLLHIAAGVFAYQIALVGGSDSELYYYDPGHFYDEGFGLSTAFVIYLVQSLRGLVGGTYLDYFMLFQAIGFLGIATLMRIFQEIYEETGEPQPIYTYLLLFLPGLHFWTSSIGKDSALFFASCLAIWGMMHMTQRYLAVAAALGLMLLIRPHIALFAIIAASLTIIFDRRSKGILKATLFACAVGAAVFVVSTVSTTFHLDITNADSVSQYLSGREEITQRAQEGMNTAVLDAPFVVKLFSLLFRPFFFDSTSSMGYVASMENVVFMMIFIIMLFRLKNVLGLTRSIAFVRYCLFFAVIVTLFLTVTYYNIGLGLRQRMMFVPAVLVIFIALQATVRRARKLSEAGLVPA
ncbi:MAG TPA: hypothetical protein VF577_04780 [Allosphingosinicella sp.]|jgi:hypothetical protein